MRPKLTCHVKEYQLRIQRNKNWYKSHFQWVSTDLSNLSKKTNTTLTNQLLDFKSLPFELSHALYNFFPNPYYSHI